MDDRGIDVIYIILTSCLLGLYIQMLRLQMKTPSSKEKKKSEPTRFAATIHVASSVNVYSHF